MVDRFANGDPSNDGTIDLADPQAFHGGDLQGIIDHLDELKDLGIKTVWISPVFKMRTEPFYGHGAFHGYWLEDPNLIEPRFGDEATLKRLNTELQKRDMRLIMDVVLNHVAPESELVARHPEWFHLKGGINDWSNTEEVQTHDVHGLPDLDQSVPEAYDWVAGTTLSWINRVGPGGFRLDAVKHISNDFWNKFNQQAAQQGGENFMLVGELLDGNPANVAEVARSGGFNAMFDFPLHFAMVDVFCRDQSPSRLAAILSADRLYSDMLGPNREGLVTLLDNHDLPRILSACGGDVSRVRQAMQFMLTARGTPSFTWGTEAGALGDGEPENRGDMVFGAGHALARVMHDGLERRRLRHVLQTGMDVILESDDGLFAYLRLGSPQDPTPQAVLVVVNATMGLREVTLPSELGADLSKVEVAAGQTSVTMVSVDANNLKAFREKHRTPTPVNVEFIVDNLKLAPGETLHLVGSGPEMGSWVPNDAPTFAPRNTQLSLNATLPSGLVFAYKLVRLKDGVAVWEERADRFVFVQPGQSIQLSFGR
ncbi:MAG: alpha-amylase family glycosyl hydrolase [bacterium]